MGGSKSNIEYRRRAVRVLLLATSAIAGVGAWRAPAQAAEAPPSVTTADAAAEAASGDTVIVTGVRGGRPRTVAQSPAPIDIIQANQIAATGRADLAESLSKLLPSLNFGQTEAGINSIVRPINNRGMGPAYTLVMIDGKRRHNSSLLTNGGGDTSGVNPVDLDMIPSSAIAYVEVLKDSAAAQYGSDAVAGVINIVLKSQDHGIHFSGLGGALYEGKNDLSTYKGEVDAGVPLGQGGFFHFGANTERRGQTWNNFFATQLPYAPASDPRNALWKGDGAHNGDPGIVEYSFFYNAELPINDTTRLYSYSTFGERQTVIGNNYRRPDSNASFDSLFSAGYYPLNNTSEYDFQVLFGAKGEVNALKWDLSTAYGRNHVRQYSDSTINPSLGPTGPTSFDDLATYQFDQWVTNLDLTRDFKTIVPEPVTVSGGAEVRVDNFHTFAGETLGWENGGYIYKAGDQSGNPNLGLPSAIGAQGGVILRPSDQVDLTRTSVAGYADVDVYPLKAWYVGAAARVEHYDDSSGSTVGGKFNSRYDFNSWFALRGTVGSGFRAPSLTQIGYAQTDSRTSTNPVTGAFGPALTLLVPTTSALGKALGAEPLKPEKSYNYGLGFVLRPLERVNITVDGYEVTVRDRIERTGTFLGPAVGKVLIANGYSGAEWVTYFANMADTRSRGVDIVLDTSRPLPPGWGRANFSVAYNYNTTAVLKVAATPAQLAALTPTNTGGSTVFFSRTVQADLTTTQPHDKLIFSGSWTRGPITLNGQLTRYGGYTYVISQLASQDRNFGAKWITDASVDYAVNRHVKLSIGAANLFSVYPDKHGIPSAGTGASPSIYGPAPFSIDGGFYYGKISFDF